MPLFNNAQYSNFSDVINSSHHYLSNYTQDKEYIDLRMAILSQAEKYSDKDDSFLERLWLKRTKQGIANTTSNGFSEAEFERNLDLLHDLTIKIKHGTEKHKTYEEAIEELTRWKKQKRIAGIYKAQVARVFATFHPNDFINWVTDAQIKNILKIFKEFNDLNVAHLKDSIGWYNISNALKLSINTVNNSVPTPLDDEGLRRLVSQIYLQNSEYGKDKFDKEVERCKNNYAKIKNKLTENIPEGSLEPEVIVVSSAARIVRDPKVKAWVLVNSMGKCEGCESSAPFKDAKGYPFLEVHHMKHLASAGSDRVTNAVALCPNCHKAIHFSSKKDDLIRKIYRKIKRLVPE